MTPQNAPIIPNEYITLKSRDIEVHNLSIRKYRTTEQFDRTNILEGLNKSHLVFGMEFGVIQKYDEDNPKHSIRALCGLVGEKDFVLLEPSSQLKYVRINHVLQATIMVEFLNDPESGCLDLLIYGGNRGFQEFFQMVSDHFAISEEPSALRFSDIGTRHLCEKFFEQLYQIVFDPLNQSGWGTISAADFKSTKGKFIDSDVKQMRQIRENQDIIIQSFKSVLYNQRIEPLQNYYNIKFSLLKNRNGIKLTVPELTLPASYSDVEYESVVYDFARHIYYQLIGQENVYEPLSEKPQMTLFD